MLRTIIAAESRELGDAVRGALERDGITTGPCCRTGAEALRAVNKLGGCVVVCSFRLPDMTANELRESLGAGAPLLVLGRPQELHLLRAPDVLHLAVPVRRSELTGTVRMLLGCGSVRRFDAAPRRSPEAQSIIERAKCLLMEKNGLTEPEAHRYLQQRSMDGCCSLAATAGLVIAAFERENV